MADLRHEERVEQEEVELHAVVGEVVVLDLVGAEVKQKPNVSLWAARASRRLRGAWPATHPRGPKITYKYRSQTCVTSFRTCVNEAFAHP